MNTDYNKVIHCYVDFSYSLINLFSFFYVCANCQTLIFDGVKFWISLKGWLVKKFRMANKFWFCLYVEFLEASYIEIFFHVIELYPFGKWLFTPTSIHVEHNPLTPYCLGYYFFVSTYFQHLRSVPIFCVEP